jgi:hypothetical protein
MHLGTKMGVAPRAPRSLGYRGLLLASIALAQACSAASPESHSEPHQQPSAAGSPTTAPVPATQGRVNSVAPGGQEAQTRAAARRNI